MTHTEAATNLRALNRKGRRQVTPRPGQMPTWVHCTVCTVIHCDFANECGEFGPAAKFRLPFYLLQTKLHKIDAAVAKPISHCSQK